MWLPQDNDDLFASFIDGRDDGFQVSIDHRFSGFN
jgi:hypothetical protein